MKITVQFDSLAEFQEHMIQHAGIGPQVQIEPSPIVEPEPEEPREDAAHVSGMCPITTQEPAQEPDPEPVKITEDFRVEVRKTLAALNKLQAGNPAKQLIAETGFKRLTDVPLDMLPGLMQKAEEAMNHV